MTAEARACRSVAARALASDLDRRAGRGSIGAEHAAGAGRGPKHGTAALAAIKERTAAGRHRFRPATAAPRTGAAVTKVGPGTRPNSSPPTGSPRKADGRKATGGQPKNGK